MTIESLTPVQSSASAALQSEVPKPEMPGFGRSLWVLFTITVAYLIAAILYILGFSVYSGITQPDLTAEGIDALIQAHLLSPFGFTALYWTTALVVLALLLKFTRAAALSRARFFAFKPVSAKMFTPWLLAYVVYALLAALVNWLWPVANSEFVDAMVGVRHLGVFITIVLVAPVVEELVFRGYFFRVWRSSFLKCWGTLMLTSILFTAMHAGQYPLQLLAVLFCFSLLLGLAREKTGSVYVPIAMHAANNLLAFILINWLGYV